MHEEAVYPTQTYQSYLGASPSPFSAQQNLGNNNPLIMASNALLTLLIQIKHTTEAPDVGNLRAQVIDELKRFEQRLVKMEYNLRTVLAARYCLCTALDEAVLAQTWGTQSIWVQQTLLNLFHKETWGGERFYIILENMAKEPRRNIDILELLYLLLSLGFEGKFFEEASATREEIRNRIFYRIRHCREKFEKSLSGNWRNQAMQQETTKKRRNVKKILLVTGSIFLLVSFYFNYKVHVAAKPLMSSLSKIGTKSADVFFSQAVNRPLVNREFK